MFKVENKKRREERKEEVRNKSELQNNQKWSTKWINKSLWTITLNVNRINAPTKRHRMA